MTFPAGMVLHKSTPIVYRLPKLSKIRKKRLTEVKPSEWSKKKCITIDTETTIDFPKKLRTIQIHIGKNDVQILGTDEQEIFDEAIRQDIEVYPLKIVRAFLQFIPFLNYKLIFFNAGFDIGQIGFSHFRKYFSLIDMKLWKLKFKKLATGNAFVKSFPRSKFLQYFFELRKWFTDNPIIQKYFRYELTKFEQMIDAAYTIYTEERAFEFLKKKLYVKDFVLDISTIASILFYRMSLKSLCETLGIRIGKKDYDSSIPLKLQLNNVLNHANVTYECARRLLKILFYDMNIKPDPCYIVSPASLTKYAFAKMNLRRPKLEVDECIAPKWNDETLMQAIMCSYFGGRVESRVKKKHVEKLYVSDFFSLYPNVARIMGLWDMMKADTLKLVRNTQKARHIYKESSLEWLKNPENWKKLNMLCHVYAGKKDGALLPVRVEKGIKRSIIVTQGNLKESIGWYMLSDVVASKIRGYDDLEIMEAFEMKKNGEQDLQPFKIGRNETEVVIDGKNEDFFTRMLDLRQKFDKKTQSGMYKLIKLIVNSAYGVTCERNKNEGGYDANKERIEIVNTIDEANKEENKIDKAGVFFNPFIGSNITAGGRLTLAIAEAMSETFTYSDTDSVFIQDLEEMERVEEYFKPLIRLEREREGRFYCSSEKRYVIWDYDDNGEIEIKTAKEHGLKNYVNIRNEERVKAVWKYILGYEHEWTEEWNGEKIYMTTKKLFDERAVRKLSLSSNHLIRSLIHKHNIPSDKLKIGDFFYVSVARDKYDKMKVCGNIKDLQEVCREENSGKTVKDCIDMFMEHDSGKTTNELYGFSKFIKFNLNGIRLINKTGSTLKRSRNDIIEIFNNQVSIIPVKIPNYGYSSHKYGFKRGDSKERMFN